MPDKCCVPACRGNYANKTKISVFRFPRNDDLKRKWLRAICRDNFIPTDYSVVCEAHFKPEDVERITSIYDSKSGRLLTAPLSKPQLREGFLCTEDSEVPGNNGLKDQVMVLRWIQENISSFGGDPNNVTLGGYSTGAVAVNYHLVSPMSKGLFHRVIIQSGSVLSPYGYLRSHRERVFKLGEAVGYRTTQSKELIKFLRRVTPERLIKAVEQAQDPKEMRRGLAFMRPAVECQAEAGEEPFLTESAMELMKMGKFHKVPVLIGFTNREGIYFCQELFANKEQISQYNKRLDPLVAECLGFEPPPQKLRLAARRIRDFYFGDKQLSMDTINEFADFYTDVQFIYGIHRIIKFLLQYSTLPVYVYQFTFDGKLGYYKPLLGLKKLSGVCHADDSGYMFPLVSAAWKLSPNSPEARVRNNYIKLLTNFVKTGDPTPEDDSSLNVKWEPATEDKKLYLEINEELKLCSEPMKERMELWDKAQTKCSSS